MYLRLVILLILSLTTVTAKYNKRGASGDAQLSAAVNVAIGQVLSTASQIDEILDTFGASINDTLPCPFNAFAWPCNPVGTLANILNSGVLSICLQTDENANDNGVTYDQLLGGYIASYIGDWYGATVTPKWVFVNTDTSYFGSFLKAITAGQCDLVLAGVTVLTWRGQFVEFTCPYAGDLFGYLVTPDVEAGAYSTLADLNNEDVVIGVIKGSSEEDNVNAFVPNAQVVYVTDDTNGVVMVENGTLTAYFSEIPIINYILKSNPCASCQTYSYGSASPIAGFTRKASTDATDCSDYSCPSPTPCPPIHPTHPTHPCEDGPRTEMNFVFDGMIPAL